MYDFYMKGMLNHEDDMNILIANQEYEHVSSESIKFTYNFTDDCLERLREKYQLKSIAGNGSEFMKLLRVTFWLASTLMFGQPESTESFHSLDILEKTNQGFRSNCFIAATVLTECFLSLGFIARMVRCMPIDLRFDECHCMTIAYLESLNKFVAFDAAMGGCYINSNGVPMHIIEIRNALINGDDIKVRSIFPNVSITKIKPYLTKNMIRFQSHRDSRYGCELNVTHDVIVNLNPITIPIKNKISISSNKCIEHLFVYNENVFLEDHSDNSKQF